MHLPLLILCLGWAGLFPLGSDKFPTPPDSPLRLFFIQRSSNTNVVVYDANFNASKDYKDQQPVHTYWIRYAERGAKQELNAMQRTLAYGLYTKRISPKEERFEAYFLAYRKRKFIITKDEEGNPIALFPINGKMQILKRVFVSVNESNLMPSVNYIELFGLDLQSKKEIYERFKP